MVENVDEIVRKLTKSERSAVAAFDGQWSAGPTLPAFMLGAIAGLRDAGLLERQFADEGPTRQFVGDDCLQIRLSACWHFRLTELGLAVRARLNSLEGEGGGD